MKARPVQRPDWRATGARPARLAACRASRVPSSGISISKAKAVICETPGMLVRMAKRLASSALASMKARMAASMAAIWRSIWSALRILPFQQRERPDFGAVLGGGAILDQRLAGDMELLEFGESLAARRTWLDRKERPHAGEQRRVEAIGLGELAGGLREAARLTRVDLDERQAGLGQGVLEGAVIRSGGLKDHARRIAADPDDQGLVASFVIAEPAAGAVGHAMDVEGLFRNIDADGRKGHLFRASACHSGLTPGIRSGHKEKTRAIKL